MEVYIVESPLPEITPEFMELIPEHREVINTLFEEGRLMVYAVSEDLSKWWCHISARDEYEVMEILGRMPIMPFLKPEVHSLMIYNGTELQMPRFSLN